MALEEFLTEVMGYVFDPKNMRKRVDNLTSEERGELRDFRKCNKDPNNPRLIRVQDKGSCFVVDFKDRYEQKVNEYVGDPSTFRSDEEDLSLEHANGVKKWVKKLRGGVEYLITYRISTNTSLHVAQSNSFMKHQITLFRIMGIVQFENPPKALKGEI